MRSGCAYVQYAVDKSALFVDVFASYGQLLGRFDARTGRAMIDLLFDLNRERGTTLLLVEQNANMALNVADHGYVLENGRIVMDDACERLREKDDIKEFYLGMKESGVRGERRWKKKKTWR